MKNSQAWMFGLSLTLACAVAVVSQPQSSKGVSTLLGDWTGESLCFGNNPNCHDEKVVYHVSKGAGVNAVDIAADKIVNGKLDPMGVINLIFDEGKQTLSGAMESPRYRGVWEFHISGDVMEGTLVILPEKTMGRRIKVQKNKSSEREALMTNHATGTFEVKLTPQDDKTGDASMGRMTVNKQWGGEVEGTSSGQMLTGGDVKSGSAGYVAIEKFAGSVKGRKGSFILQHSGTMTAGKGDLTISVVPDSGTDDLKGISGKLTIKIENGKHFYDFEYTLPESH